MSKWNKELVGLNGQTMGNNLIINGTFDTNVDGWTATRATLTWQLGGFCRLTQNQTASNTMVIQQSLTVGKRYLITFDAKAPVITSKPGVIAAHFSNIIAISNPDLSPNWQKYAYEATAKVSLVLYLPLGSVDPGTVVDVDNISVVELQPKLLLDYDSTNGYITDRTGKNTLTATEVSIRKTGSFYGAEFNGVTSKIDTGSDFIGTKAITVCGWIYNTNSIGYQRILDNSKFRLGLHTTNTVQVTSDQVKFLYSLKTVPLNSWQFISITRKVDGKISFYLGDKSNSPVLNGSVDLDSGTPTVAASNVFIGSHPSGTTFFYGNIPTLKVFDGILDLETITQIWSSTRGKVN